jgi:HSP20 family protein
VRYRRFTFRYAEVTRRLPRALEAEPWTMLRPRPMASPFHRPPADVIETQSAYLVQVELPGVADDQVDVYLHPDAVVVTGRRTCTPIDGAQYHRAEIRHGPFRFDLPMPSDADLERVDAVLERGVLHLRLPKQAEKRTTPTTETCT